MGNAVADLYRSNGSARLIPRCILLIIHGIIKHLAAAADNQSTIFRDLPECIGAALVTQRFTLIGPNQFAAKIRSGNVNGIGGITGRVPASSIDTRKGILCNAGSITQPIDIFQHLTSVKGGSSNFCHSLAQLDALQIAASIEGILADGGYTIANHNIGQVCTMIESVII